MSDIHPELFERAEYDEEYGLWLQRLADVCEHYMNLDLLSILDNVVEEDVSTWEVYLRGMSPEFYFKTTVLSVLEVDFGVDYIEEIVHNQVMWGAR